MKNDNANGIEMVWNHGKFADKCKCKCKKSDKWPDKWPDKWFGMTKNMA